MKDPILRKYHNQKDQAKARGIIFLFSFEEWCQWWKDNLGPDWVKKRGRKKGQYVMARNGDIGPYAPWNVKCIPCSDNCSEQRENGTLVVKPPKLLGSANGRSKLSEKEVMKIFVSQSSTHALSRQYGVDRNVIRGIREGSYWTHVTGRTSQLEYKGE